MKTTKIQHQTINRLLSLVNEKGLKVGEGLPSERKLATMLEVSRNTVREVIRVLEERGLVEVRIGSGCYLKADVQNIKEWESYRPADNPAIIKSQLEARYIIVPRVAALGIERMSEENIARLEATTVRLSKAIIDRNFTDIIREDNKFREIMAESTGNPILQMMIKQLEINNHLTWELFTEFPEQGMHKIFACYVKTINAIRSRNVDRVQFYVANNILTMCRLLTEFTEIRFSDHLQKCIETLPDSMGDEDED